jgi:hypothetical protein
VSEIWRWTSILVRVISFFVHDIFDLVAAMVAPTGNMKPSKWSARKLPPVTLMVVDNVMEERKATCIGQACKEDTCNTPVKRKKL